MLLLLFFARRSIQMEASVHLSTYHEYPFYYKMEGMGERQRRSGPGAS